MVGQTQKKEFVQTIKANGWGRMWSRDWPNIYNGEPWGWDNGAYSWWVHGKPFHDVTFWQRLWRDYAVGVPYLAACPDKPAEGDASLHFSLWWIDRLPKAWPWYLVIQDGMSVESVKVYAKRFAGLFLGGTNEFKKEADAWCWNAHQWGLKFHYGRCGTADKFNHAKSIGADSIDSATPVFEEGRFYRFADMVNGSTPHAQLELAVSA